jgi:predicted nucleic acid-binding protein
MTTFDTNVLVYATAARADDRVGRAQDLLARAMRATRRSLFRLEQRLGRLHAKQRLGIEKDHEAQIFGQGINFLSH